MIAKQLGPHDNALLLAAWWPRGGQRIYPSHACHSTDQALGRELERARSHAVCKDQCVTYCQPR